MGEIIIERGALRRVGALAGKFLPVGKAAIISDDGVAPIHLPAVAKSLEDAGWESCRFVFPRGEKSKTLKTYEAMLNFLCENRLTRRDTVFALGGGVTGDMAGFAAASYLRGVNLVQIPTSLLAAVDSSVGGKTGVNLEAGKNLVGAFYPARLTVTDPDALDTLDGARIRDGMAEVVKCAAIGDAALFDEISGLPDADGREAIIRRCVDIKLRLVALDERDYGPRQLLNFGHSFGHAMEKKSGYALSHGSAVAVGMAVMARACARRGLCGGDCARRLIEKLRALSLPTETPFRFADLKEPMLSDKKRAGAAFTLIVLRGIGRAERLEADEKTALDFLREGLEQWT